MKNIKYIFFDIGYTLVDEDEVWNQRCHEQSQMSEAKTLDLTHEKIYDEIVKATNEFLPQYRTFIKKNNIKEQAPYRYQFERLFEGAEDILRVLSLKYKLGIIANQGDGLTNRLEEFKILKYFNLIISSWDYQTMKPDKRIFEIALEKASVRPNECVMIGDRLDNDIYPAKLLGMKTIWIRQGLAKNQEIRSEEYSPDFQIYSLNDLLHIL